MVRVRFRVIVRVRVTLNSRVEARVWVRICCERLWFWGTKPCSVSVTNVSVPLHQL